MAPVVHMWEKETSCSHSDYVRDIHHHFAQCMSTVRSWVRIMSRLKLYMVLTWAGLYLSDFHWGVRVSTGYDWPSDYSGHGGSQIDKRRIVVHKYTGLARKWNRELLGGFESTPKEVLQNFLGINYLLRAVKPLTPVKYSPAREWIIYTAVHENMILHYCGSFRANFTGLLKTSLLLYAVRNALNKQTRKIIAFHQLDCWQSSDWFWHTYAKQ